MSNPSDDDMDKPITRRELQEVLGEAFANFLKMLDMRFVAVDKRFADSEATNRRLMLDIEKRFAADTRAALQEVTRYHRDELSTIDDKYKDLPERVTKLEAKVFAPKRRRRR